MALQALLPMATTLLSGAFGMSQQSNYLEQQRVENLNAFNRNKELALLQNKLNVEQWERENAYNHPIEQMKRLQSAGLNPDMIYGGGASNNISATSPSMTAGSPYQPVDYSLGGQRKTIGDVVQNTINTSMQSAQIELLKAQADKTKSETIGQNISNDVNAQLLLAKTQAEVEQILSGTDLNKKEIEQITANIDKFKKECDVFDATIQEKFANIDNMTFQQFRSMLDYELDKNLNEATIKQIEAETSLTQNEIRQIQLTLPMVLAKYATEIKLNQANTEEAKEQRNLIFEQICTEVVKRANIKKDTLLKNNQAAVYYHQSEAYKNENVISGDKAQRYEKLWGINKDILFTIDMLLGGTIGNLLPN